MKLTEYQVREIKQAPKRHRVQIELAAKFGVSRSTINSIRVGRRRSDVEYIKEAKTSERYRPLSDVLTEIADTDRLDWIEKTRANIEPHGFHSKSGTGIFLKDGHDYWGESVRQAIDRAILGSGDCARKTPVHDGSKSKSVSAVAVAASTEEEKKESAFSRNPAHTR